MDKLYWQTSSLNSDVGFSKAGEVTGGRKGGAAGKGEEVGGGLSVGP